MINTIINIFLAVCCVNSIFMLAFAYVGEPAFRSKYAIVRGYALLSAWTVFSRVRGWKGIYHRYGFVVIYVGLAIWCDYTEYKITGYLFLAMANTLMMQMVFHRKFPNRVIEQHDLLTTKGLDIPDYYNI